jgi:hypothetical protein
MPRQLYLHIVDFTVRRIEWRSPILASTCPLIGGTYPIQPDQVAYRSGRLSARPPGLARGDDRMM